MNTTNISQADNGTKRQVFHFLQSGSGIVVFAVIFIVGTIITEGAFARPSNLIEVLLRASVIGIVALGQNLVIFTGGIDLSVGSVFGLGVGIISYCMKNGIGPELAILYVLLASIACGMVNGLIVSRTKMSPFVITLGMMMIAQSVALTVVGAGAEDMPELVNLIRNMMSFIPAGPTLFPLFVWIFAVVIIGLFIVFTRFGPNMFAIGGKELAAIYSGVNARQVKFLLYTICGLCAGIGGILLCYRIGGANPLAGGPYLLMSIAAVVIGGTNIYGGEGNVFNTIIGAITLSILVNLMNIVQINPFIQDIVIGLILIFLVFALNKLKEIGEGV